MLALVALSNIATPSWAADVPLPSKHGSEPVPAPIPATRAPDYKCYVRSDLGYSRNVDNFDGIYNSPTTNNRIDSGYFLDSGVGCGSGDLRGFRADVVAGIREKRDIRADPPNSPGANVTLFSDVESYTLMANVYYDFGNMRGLVLPVSGQASVSPITRWPT